MAQSFTHKLTTALCVAGFTLFISLPAAAQSGTDSVHQPIVQRSDYIIDLPVQDGLAAQDVRRLSSWLAALNPAYGDSIGLDPASNAMDAEVRTIIATVLSQYGLPLAASAPVTQGELAPGHIRIVLSRMTASVPGCPDWSHPGRTNSARYNLSNYGCATNASLAAMVADPTDLLVGRKARPATLSPVSGRVIDAYKIGGASNAAPAAAPAGADAK
jgi:pilus assembly protein CpaD